MDLKALVAQMAPEDVDKLSAILPILKEKVKLDRLIEETIAGKKPVVKPKEEKPEAQPTKTKTAKKPTSKKKAKAKKAAPKVAAENPAQKLPVAPKKPVAKLSPKKPAPKAAPAKPSPAAAKAPTPEKTPPTMTQAALAFLEGKKDASMDQIARAVAKARNMKLTKKTRNVIKVNVYANKKLKRVAPGRFALP